MILTDANMLAHLLKYATVHGTLEQDVTVDGDSLVVGGHKVKVLAERDQLNLVGEKENLGVEYRCRIYWSIHKTCRCC